MKKRASKTASPTPEEQIAVLRAQLESLARDNERLAALFHRAQTLRDEGKTVTVQTMKKNIRRQIELLEAEGYTEIEKVYKN